MVGAGSDAHHATSDGRRVAEEHALEQFCHWVLCVMDLAQQRRLSFVDRLRDRRQEDLCWWKWFVYGTALLRVICSFTILVLLVNFRNSKLEHLVPHMLSPSGMDVSQFLIFNGMYAMGVLCFFIILTELLLVVAAVIQNPNTIPFVFAANSVLVFLLIVMGCFAAGALAHVDSVTAIIFATNVASERPRRQMENHQRAFECCGADGPQDWLHLAFFEYDDLARTRREKVLHKLEWMVSCNPRIPEPCSVPHSCCRNESGCHFAGRLDKVAMLKASHAGDQTRMTELEPNFQPQRSEILQLGCYPPLRDTARRYLTAIGVMIFLLCLLSVVTTFLFIVVLIYHSSHGEVDQRAYVVSYANSSPLVRFFLWLDGRAPWHDPDVTDFSIIEHLKNLDVDYRLDEHEDDGN